MLRYDSSAAPAAPRRRYAPQPQTPSQPAAASIAPAEAVLHRIMPQLAPQFHLTLHPGQPDGFRITGTPGNIHVDAATIPTLLYGVNWYLKYVAHLQVSTQRLCS